MAFWIQINNLYSWSNSFNTFYSLLQTVKIYKTNMKTILKYNEIVQCPETQSVTTTLIVGGQLMDI